MGWLRLSFVLSVALLGCDRAEPESFPQSSHARTALSASPGATGAGAVTAAARPVDPPLSGRCVTLTPASPPPPVASAPASGCPSDPEEPQAGVAVQRIAFPDVSGVSVDAEVVRTEHDTMRGLMYRRSLPESRGMLFDLRVRDDHKFWMHNTCIPLDMIFVDDDGLIVGLVENVPTLNDESRSVGCPSRWVLEVNAGWARRHGVRAGQRMALPL